MPILVEFDPRSPTEISDAHKLTVATLNFRIRITVFLSLLAAILVSLSVILSSVSKSETAAQHDLNARVFTLKDERVLSITSQTDHVDSVLVRLKSTRSDSTLVSERLVVLTPTESGFIQSGITLNASEILSHNITVELEWISSNNTLISLSKTVEISKHTSNLGS
jgi:hypothetical protein